MTSEDIQFVADALLALCERDAQRPFYTEEQMRLRTLYTARKDPFHAHILQARGEDPLVLSECRGVVRHARLTRRQMEVLAKRMDGWSFGEIALRAGHSKQGARSIFLQALKKLARALHVYPFRGLSDVYWRETHRGVRSGGLGRIQVQVHR